VIIFRQISTVDYVCHLRDSPAQKDDDDDEYYQYQQQQHENSDDAGELSCISTFVIYQI